MPHYTVCTPMLYHSYGYDEPGESYADCTTVDAPTIKAAKVAAVKQLRKDGSDYVNDTHNPFTGLEVYPNMCEHGNCMCELSECVATREYDICPECEKLWDLEDAENDNLLA